MKGKVSQLIKNRHNAKRKNLMAIVRAWSKFHEAMDEMDQAILKMCLQKRNEDSR